MSSDAVQKQENVSNFPMNVEDAGFQLVQARSELKRLQNRVDGLKKFLADNMPELHPEEGDEQARTVEMEGVKRWAWLAPSTKWTEVMNQLKEEVIPKTKWDRADEIKQEKTKLGYREKFTFEEE